MSRCALLLFAGLSLSSACRQFAPFECDENKDCVQDGVLGSCETSEGVCTFEDSTCVSGQRYSRLAPGNLSSQCVDPGADTTDSDSSDGCRDEDGDGAGLGPDCDAADCDDGNPLVSDDCVYLAPGGDDFGDGTRDQPFRTFSRAVQELAAGRSLVLLDGTFSAATNGAFKCDCEADPPTCPAGTGAAKIHISAENERQAVLEASAGGHALLINGCDHYTLSGLTLVAPAEAGGSTIPLGLVDADSTAVLRSLLIDRADRFDEDAASLYVTNGADLLVEDVEIYSGQRSGLRLEKTERTTIRRVFLRGSSADGTRGVYLHNTRDSIIENVLTEEFRQGFFVRGHTADGAVVGARILGSVVTGKGLLGSGIGSGIDAFADTPDGLQDVVLRDFVAIGVEHGVRLWRGGAVSIEHATFLSAATAVRVSDKLTDYACDAQTCELSLSYVLVEAPLTGASIDTDDGHRDVRMHGCNVEPGIPEPYPPGESWDDDDGWLTANSVLATPRIGLAPGQCRLAVPSDGATKGADSSGVDIGANVDVRYVDGQRSSAPLWDPQTHAFPCRAQAAPFNTTPETSCIGVHERLAVAACEL